LMQVLFHDRVGSRVQNFTLQFPDHKIHFLKTFQVFFIPESFKITMDMVEGVYHGSWKIFIEDDLI
jgi:hypothetical protein